MAATKALTGRGQAPGAGGDSFQAEIVSVQLDGDRPGLPDHVGGGQDEGLPLDRGDDGPAALRRAPADHHGRPEGPIVGGDHVLAR